MQVLGIKKFFFDYLVAGGLLFLLFLLLLKNITVWDEGATIVLSQACSSSFPAEEVLQSMQDSLKDGESCSVISPCVEWQSIHCEQSVPVSSLLDGSLNGDTLVTRMRSSPVESFGISSHEVTTVEKASAGLLLLLLAYGLVLTEACAVLFALWRQRKLKQTLTLPPGSRKDQLLKPVFFATLLAIAIVLLNYLVYYQFDQPEAPGRENINLLFGSASGIFIAIFIAPIAEELLFRGVLLRFFVEKKMLLLGTVVVSLLFAVLHGFHEQSLGLQLYISTLYFIISVFLCRLYITQKNVWSPIVFHSAYNSTMVSLFMILS